MTNYFNIYTLIIWLRARRVKQICRASETLLHSTIWHALDIFTRQTVFQEVGWGGGGEWTDCGIWKDAYSLSHSLFAPFFARSLIHYSLIFFARPHWPRAWHRLRSLVFYPSQHIVSTYADDKQISYADRDITTVKELINADFPGADNWLDHNGIKRKSYNSSFEK